LAIVGWGPDFYDAAGYLDPLLAGSKVGDSNFARFDSPRYNQLLARASRLSGQARDRAYANLDVELARDAAPLAAFANERQITFVSKRVDPRCVVTNPFLDLAAVCLKR
jgi:dipeptide transport system substrate-binding protein